MSCCAPVSTCDKKTSVASERTGLSWARLLTAAFIAGNTMIWSLTVNFSDLQGTERRTVHLALLLSSCMVALLCGGHLWQQIKAACKRRNVGLEALFSSGILGALAYSLHSTWYGRGDVYFEVISLLVVIYAFSSKIKGSAQKRVLEALQATMSDHEMCSKVLAGGGTERVPVSSIRVGDVVAVEPGELVKIDGDIVQGRSFLSEASLTGEGFCRARTITDKVTAGARNLDGHLAIRATVEGTRRVIDDALSTVMRGLAKRSAVELRVEVASRWFFPVVAAVSLLTWCFWYTHGGAQPAFLNAMAVLLVACPCALGFATPVTLWAAVVRLSKLGIRARDSAAIERLASVDTVIFDKTGTLTVPSMAAAAITLLPKSTYTQREVRSFVRAAQTLSDHPIARAFACLAADDEDALYIPLHVKVLPGKGIEARVRRAGRAYTVSLGEPAAMFSNAWVPQGIPTTASKPIAITIDGQPVAIASVEDSPCADAHSMLSILSAAGLRCEICSGDSVQRLKTFRVDAASGSMQAAEKSMHIDTLTAQGRRVCFVGDGFNDAQAMARSRTSIAMTSGASLVCATADFSMPQSSLRSIPEAVAITRRAWAILTSNLYLAVFYNIVGMSLAAAGLLHPAWAATLMLTSSLTVTLRGASLLAGDSIAVPLRTLRIDPDVTTLTSAA